MRSFTDGRPLDAKTVSPEVGAAVGHGAVAEQVAVADGVQVGDRAEVVSAGTAAPSPLAVGAKRVPDAADVERAGQLPLGPPGEEPFGSATAGHQEKRRRRRQQKELHGESAERKRTGSRTQEVYREVRRHTLPSPGDGYLYGYGSHFILFFPRSGS